MISGYAHFGWAESVFLLYDQMLRQCNIGSLDKVMVMSVLKACSNAGFLDEAQIFLDSITQDKCEQKMLLTYEHYVCIADLFGRSGNPVIALDVLHRMPFQPTIVIWHSIMAACWKWGNVMLAEEVFENILQLKEDNVTAYICMSNMYAYHFYVEED